MGDYWLRPRCHCFNLMSFLIIAIHLQIVPLAATSNKDVIYFLSGGTAGSNSGTPQTRIYSWGNFTADDNDVDADTNPSVYITAQDANITSLSCSFWTASTNKQYFVTKNGQNNRWSIMSTRQDGSTETVLDENIGINGISELEYDPTLDRIYFVNTFVNHWQMEVFDVKNNHRIVLFTTMSDNVPAQDIKIHIQKQTLFWIEDGINLHYANLDGSNKRMSALTTDLDFVEISGYGDSIYVAYKTTIEKREFQNGEWVVTEGNIEKTAEYDIRSIFATDAFLYVALSSGEVYSIEFETTSTTTTNTVGKMGMDMGDICVATSQTVDPSGYKSACSGNSPCEQFCFDVQGAPTCYCSYDAEKTDAESSEACPDHLLHVVISHSLRLDAIRSSGYDDNASFSKTFAVQGNDTTVNSISYSSKDDSIYVAIGTNIKRIHQADAKEDSILNFDYQIRRIRIDDEENRLYVSGDSGDIEFYQIDAINDSINTTRHLVISRIHASDFDVDTCSKTMYIASENPYKIVKSSLYGGNFETILDDRTVGKVGALCVDNLKHLLYFADNTRNVIGKINLSNLSQPIETVYEYGMNSFIDSMALYEDYLYFYNDTVNTVLKIDLTVKGAITAVKVFDERQHNFRFTSLYSAQCNEKTECEFFNGGCMDECHLDANGMAVCGCKNDNQYLISSIYGFCDWSNKTRYCLQSSAWDLDTHLSCDWGQKCILKQSICDGVRDCSDGSDEDESVCSRKICEDRQFKCHNGKCIANTKVCDHYSDCADGSDEINCDYESVECQDNEYRCPGNHRCIPETSLCNGRDDCRDGLASDETVGQPSNCGPANCTEYNSVYRWLGIEFVACTDTHICIQKTWRCDNHAGDCGTNSDEEGCESYDCGTAFKCNNGFCVYPPSWVCDNYNDCGDFSDEADEVCESNDAPDCGEDFFQCENRKCIPKEFRCDTDNDCGDNSDEELPFTDCTTLECNEDQFRCQVFDRSRRRCILKSQVCDQVSNCEDGEDERQNCPAPEKCESDEFTCNNKLCIPKLQYCDKYNDCGDGSDEPNGECDYEECDAQSEFTCNNGRCVWKAYKCDGLNHCGDMSDEQDCSHNPDVFSCDLETKFECPGLIKKCIDNERVCDGIDDCDHGADELQCDVNECKIETLNDCEQNCVDLKSGYRCTCNDGYQLDELNGRTCVDINECDLMPKYCTQNCENVVGSVTCLCESGYDIAEDENNKKTICKHQSNDAVLLFTDEFSVRTYDVETEEAKFVEEEGDLITAADFDYSANKVFFVDVSNRTIVTSSLDGTNRKILFNRDVDGVEGIAVDWIGKNIYWLNQKRGTLEVATQSGVYRKVLKDTGLKKPRAIVLYPKHKLLFYSDWGSGNEHIGRMYMDGSKGDRIVTSRISWANGLTIDYTTDTLYWVDAHLQSIESCNLDGSNRFLIASSVTHPETLAHPFAVTVFDQFLFWTDWNKGTINRADKRNGKGAEPIYDAIKRPMDIHVIHPLRQLNNVKDAFDRFLPSFESTGCAIMLLTVNDNTHYVCECPEHFVLDSDGKKCVSNCPIGYKLCSDSSLCYPAERYCDKNKDCPDNSDEPSSCPKNPCLPGQLHCLGSDKCVEHSQICDGRFQCKDLNSDDQDARNDKTDESNCEDHACPANYRKCNNHLCVHEVGFCNGVDNCGDNSDEMIENCPRCDLAHEFQCNDGKCIPLTYRCDFDKDCGGGEDEPATCSSEVANCRKEDGKFSCRTNYRCISDTLVCNGMDDCRDNSDERDCDDKGCVSGYFQCGGDNKCIPERYKCDFTRHCSDGSDESNETCHGNYRECDPKVEFKCENKECIPKKSVCDMSYDCNDGSDEDEEVCQTQHQCRSADQFQCTQSGHCISSSKRCLDGNADCPDKSDEFDCPARYPSGRYCREDQFTCNNTVCISPNLVCNAFDDCGDGSDELHSTDQCQHLNCDAPNLYPCSSGECIYDFHICSGKAECADGSDESDLLCNQGSHQCASDPNMLRCHNGIQCYRQQEACDGSSQCDDQTDELGCHNTPCSDNNGGCEHNCMSTQQNGEDVYYCTCRAGFTHSEQNPKECVDINECLAWDTCSHEECENSKGGFTCKCPANYELSVDGKVCKAVGDPVIYFYLKEDKIMKMVDEPAFYQNTETISHADSPVSFDFNVDNNTLLWLNNGKGEINQCIIPNYGIKARVEYVEKIKLPNNRIPKISFSVDWIHQLMYFFEGTGADSGFKLTVSTIDGRYPKSLTDDIFHDPRDVVVDPINGFVYVSNYNNEELKGKIHKLMNNGEVIEDLVSDSIGDPRGIAVDYFKDGRVYWADYSQRSIHSIAHDGSDRVTLAYFGDSSLKLEPLSLFIFEHEVYFTANSAEGVSTDNGLYKRSKFNGTSLNEVYLIKTDISMSSPFMLYHEAAKPQTTGDNHCVDALCSHLCLPTHSDDPSVPLTDQHVCACPDGVKFKSGSNRDCDASVQLARYFAPCNGNGLLSRDLKCVCSDDYDGDQCQNKTSESSGVLGGVIFLMVLVLICVVLFMMFIYKDHIRDRLQSLRRSYGNTPVNFHVGGRANPGFNTAENDDDRITLGRDFHGIVDEGAMTAYPNSSFGVTNSGGTAFSNPVYEIKEAQTAIENFQPPEVKQNAYSDPISMNDSNDSPSN